MKQTGHLSNSDYILGHAEDELDRLVDQARFYGNLTEHLFHLAGIQRGMRVLDVGCGVGDMTFLAARLVGPDGYVIGMASNNVEEVTCSFTLNNGVYIEITGVYMGR